MGENSSINRDAAVGQTVPTDHVRVFDLHCDTLDRLVLGDDSFIRLVDGDPSLLCDLGMANQPPPSSQATLKNNSFHVSLERVAAFDWCQCFAVFIPDALQGETAWRFYQTVKQYFKQQLAEQQDCLQQAWDFPDIELAFAAARSAAIATIEGASFFEHSLAPVDEIAQDGVKLITLTWNNQNAIAAGAHAQGGFSSFGRKLVAALEEQQITIDVSHLNDQSFKDLRSMVRRPFLASHSNSRAICNHPRNLTDDQFRAIQDCGGVVGLNYCNYFLVEDSRPVMPEDVLRHLDHWLKLDGELNIALGSDYDGADMPDWLSPCENLSQLYGHVQQEFGNQIAEKLFFQNAHDFYARNW